MTNADELFRLATTDQLTGLANRAIFLDRLRHAIASSYRTQRRLAVLMLDMDGLQSINDTFGRRAGDAALQELARRIAAELRNRIPSRASAATSSRTCCPRCPTARAPR